MIPVGSNIFANYRILDVYKRQEVRLLSIKFKENDLVAVLIPSSPLSSRPKLVDVLSFSAFVSLHHSL